MELVRQGLGGEGDGVGGGRGESDLNYQIIELKKKGYPHKAGLGSQEGSVFPLGAEIPGYPGTCFLS